MGEEGSDGGGGGYQKAVTPRFHLCELTVSLGGREVHPSMVTQQIWALLQRDGLRT